MIPTSIYDGKFMITDILDMHSILKYLWFFYVSAISNKKNAENIKYAYFGSDYPKRQDLDPPPCFLQPLISLWY